MTAIETNGGARRPLHKQVTGIREVARLAGVSVGTVSNVANHPERVSAETRSLVQAAIERLDFVPNRGAADLRRGHSRMLGLVVPDITNPFFADMARGVVDAATAHGYVAVLCNSDSDAAKEGGYLELLEEQRVSGVLITPVGKVSPRLLRLRSRQAGIVIVDRVAKVSEFCSVSVDDVAGGEVAANHLLATGARQLVLVNGPGSVRQCGDRRKGARRAVRHAGLSDDSLVEITVPAMTVDEGVAAAERLLPTLRPGAAVFCTNDLLAVGVQRALTRAGVSIPEDVAVVGYDDIDRAGDLPIPLTSIRQPKYDLGHVAGDLLIKEITEQLEHEHERIVFQPTLVPRASTARADASARTGRDISRPPAGDRPS